MVNISSSELGYLAFNFFRHIDVVSVSFSHVYENGNCPAHLLPKDALVSYSVQGLATHAITLDLNNI